ISFEEYLRNAFVKESLPVLLKQKGYRVDLFPYAERGVYYSEEVSSNIVQRAKPLRDIARNLARLYDVTCFRVLPGPAKSLCFSNGEGTLYLLARSWFDGANTEAEVHSQSVSFGNQLTANSTVNLEQGAFKYYH